MSECEQPASSHATLTFLEAVQEQDRSGCIRILETHPQLASNNIHVAAVLGQVDEVKRLADADATRVGQRGGNPSGEPLLWLCYSPFHGESEVRDEALAATARVLLSAGADPNTRDERHGVPVLYAVTGLRSVPRIARMLLEAGASPNDGESVFHAAERFHLESLELLQEFGVDVNLTGEWGNTPLWFLLRYHDVGREEGVKRGVSWLLAHGANPNVPSGREQESALHVAIRRKQHVDVIRQLIEHGADVSQPNGDGITPWLIAFRAGADDVLLFLEQSGAAPVQPSTEDRLIAACSRGDMATAAQLTSPGVIASLDVTTLRMLPEAAARGELDEVKACLAAGFPVDIIDADGATALHRACIDGRAPIVAVLLQHGADHSIWDPEHHATALGWATFGSDLSSDQDRQFEETVRLLFSAGAKLSENDYEPQHPGVAAVLHQAARDHVP